MWIAIIAIFCAGVANFAMHRAFMESDDATVRQMIAPLVEKTGPHFTYIFEFLLLVGAMAIATRNWFTGLLLYGLYTMFNAMAFNWIMRGPK